MCLMHIVALHLTHTHTETVLTTKALEENEHTSTLIMLLQGTKGWFKSMFLDLCIETAHSRGASGELGG